MSRPALVGLLCGAALVLVGWLTLAMLRPEPAVPSGLPSVARPVDAEGSALAIVHNWDRRRAAAYAAGSPRALRALYAPGSTAARADVTVLRGYRSRGLRVTDLRMQVLAARVVARSPRRLRLVITDRLASVAVHRGDTLVDVPRDRPTTRHLTLLRPGGDEAQPWLMATVR